jgi:hypothetical protein
LFHATLPELYLRWNFTLNLSKVEKNEAWDWKKYVKNIFVDYCKRTGRGINK